MPLINWKVELKRKWMNHCVLSANGNDNIDADPNNIIFTIKGTKLYVPIVTLSAKNNKKLSKLLSKGFERSVYWNEHKTKSENKNTTNDYRNVLESNFVGVNRLFCFIQTKIIILKSIKPEGIIYQKVLLRIIMSSSMVSSLIPM